MIVSSTARSRALHALAHAGRFGVTGDGRITLAGLHCRTAYTQCLLTLPLFLSVLCHQSVLRRPVGRSAGGGGSAGGPCRAVARGAPSPRPGEAAHAGRWPGRWVGGLCGAR